MEDYQLSQLDTPVVLKDSQAYMVGCILTKIKKDYSEK